MAVRRKRSSSRWTPPKPTSRCSFRRCSSHGRGCWWAPPASAPAIASSTSHAARASSRASLPTVRASSGSVVGLDRNPAMLAVAERLRPDIEWREGDASGLPFLARSFDVVLCQAALMFFSDPRRALAEMARAIKDDGIVAIQVWDRLDDQPAYRPFVDAAARVGRAGRDGAPQLVLLAGRPARAAGAAASRRAVADRHQDRVDDPAVRLGRRVRDDGGAEHTARGTSDGRCARDRSSRTRREALQGVHVGGRDARHPHPRSRDRGDVARSSRQRSEAHPRRRRDARHGRDRVRSASGWSTTR